VGQCSQAAGPGQAAEVSASSEWLGCVWDCAANTVGQLRRQLRQAFTAPAAESGAPLQSPSFYISMIVESLEETGAGRLGLRGAGRRSRGEQAERSESHHRLPSSVARFMRTSHRLLRLCLVIEGRLGQGRFNPASFTHDLPSRASRPMGQAHA